MKGDARPALRSGCCRVGVLAAALLACSSGPWVSAAPVELGSAGLEPFVIVARCMARAQELGYSVESVDFDGGWLQLVSLHSEAVMLGMRPVPKSSSWLLVTVADDQTVSVRALGDLVSQENGRMHPELRAEMDWLAGELESAIRQDPRTPGGEPVEDSR